VGVVREVRAECLAATPRRATGKSAGGGANRATAGNSWAAFAPSIGPATTTDFDLSDSGLGANGACNGDRDSDGDRDCNGEATAADASDAARA
jgi:hypothetical protein